MIRTAAAALLVCAGAAHAQTWSNTAARDLVQRVIERRAAQVADTSLAGYDARARGTLEFLAQFGDTALIPPKIIRASEIALEIHWTAPNISREVVVGLRDTTLVPMEIGFYRDRYGIVQSNLPDRIRLGDGNDVADIVHPFSRLAPALYEFALGDSIHIAAGGERLTLQEIRFRPRDPKQPLAVGSAYVSRTTSDVVRLSLTFTRAALLDKSIEALSIVLENELVEGRYWLPRRQELEVQRAGSVLDFPARGIVRARWSICCYDLRFTSSVPSARPLPGPALAFRSPAELRAFQFSDSLFTDLGAGPQALRPEDIARVQAQAREAIGNRMLRRPAGTTWSATALSDLVRFDRAEGLAVGAGGTMRVAAAADASLTALARYGFSDHRAKGNVSLSLPIGGGAQIRLFGERAYRDVSDVMETSAASNSLVTQEFGSDRTDPFDVRGAGVELSTRAFGAHWRLEGEREIQHPLAVRAPDPVVGRFEPLLPAASASGERASLFADGARYQPLPSTWLQIDGELRLGFFDITPSTARSTFARTFVNVRTETGAGRDAVATESFATLDVWNGTLPPQQLAFFGGPLTAPGYDFHEFAGRAGMSQRVEWRHQVSWAAVPVGVGSVASITTAALYLNAVWIDRAGRGSAAYPSVGAAIELFSGFARLDVARGLGGPRGHWLIGIDAGRAYWSVL